MTRRKDTPLLHNHESSLAADPGCRQQLVQRRLRPVDLNLCHCRLIRLVESPFFEWTVAFPASQKVAVQSVGRCSSVHASLPGRPKLYSLRPARALSDPSAQFPNFITCQRGEFLALRHGRHFEIFHLILDESEEETALGVAGNDGRLAALTALQRQIARGQTITALGLPATVTTRA
jgi:hypothetical protein